MPQTPYDQPRRGSTMTGPPRRDPADPRRGPANARRDPADDVRAAHDGARRATAAYGSRRSSGSGDGAGRWLRTFVRRYGWRAYALPVLAVITVAALMTSTAGTSKSQPKTDKPAPAAAVAGKTGTSSPAAAPSQMELKDDAPGAGADSTVLKGYALPKGPAYTMQGDGTYRLLKGTSPIVGTSGRLWRYSIDVENGVTGIDLAQYQKLVVSVLSDKRSWSGHGVRLERVDSGPVDFHVTLTSALTVRTLCGYSIPVETSCYAAAGSVTGLDTNRVVFNVARWVRGSAAYVGDLAAYRIYMINHEDGHALGHEHAHQCLPGGLAPAMMQQSFGLRSAVTKQICQANPWPYPPGVKGAPGAEQPDTAQNDEYKLGD